MQRVPITKWYTYKELRNNKLTFSWRFWICMKSLILKWSSKHYANEDNHNYAWIDWNNKYIDCCFFYLFHKHIDSKTKNSWGIIIEKLAGAKMDNIYYKSQGKRWKTFIFLSPLINQHNEWVDIGIIWRYRDRDWSCNTISQIIKYTNNSES